MAGSSIVAIGRGKGTLARGFAWSVISIAALNLARMVCLRFLGFEVPSLVTSWDGSALPMPAPGALCFLLTGVGLLAVGRAKGPGVLVLGIAGASIMALSLAVGLTMLAGLPTTFGVGKADDMALPAAVAFLWLAFFFLGEIARKNQSGEGRITALIAGSLGILTATVILATATRSEAGRTNDLVERSWVVKSNIDQLNVAVARFQAASRAFMLTADEGYLELMAKNQKDAWEHFGSLEKMATEPPKHRALLTRIRPLLDAKFLTNEHIVEVRKRQGIEAVVELFNLSSSSPIQQVLVLLDELATEDDRMLEERRRQSHRIESKSVLLRFLSTGVGFVLTCMAFTALRRARRRVLYLNEELERRVARRTAQLHDANTHLAEQNRRLETAEQTARKAEQYLRSVLANSPIILWAVDIHGVYTLREGRALANMGHRPGQGVGQLQAEVMADCPATLEHTKLAMQGESSSAEMLYRNNWYNNRYTPLKSAEGAVIGVIGVSTDITARKQAEQLTISEEGARQASKLKSEFLAKMSHEIRTPMNGVVGMTSLLAQTSLTPDQQEMVGVVQSSANILLTVINDILDLSKIEAGKLQIDPSDFDLRQLVEEVLAPMSPRAVEKNLELLNDFDPAMSTGLHGDSVRIRQVLTNLLGNALKFTAKRHVLVRVRPKEQTPDRVGFRIEIEDTGIGLTREAQSRLFQPFMQAERSTSTKFGGTGLGLAISKQLIELMGGSIGIISTEGKGSVFWFELDLPRAHIVASVADQGELPAGLRLLVVDDNPTNAAILTTELVALGALVDTASDGQEAIDLALDRASAGTCHAVVLVDRFMPKMNGEEFARILRATAPVAGIPLILLSPYLAPTEDEKLFATLFQARLAKPVRRAQLLRAISRTLGLDNPSTKKAATTAQPVQLRRSLNVLLAEDNLVNQRVARLMLEKIGHKVDIAGDGEEVLRKINARQYDVVLMDCQMPVLDGFGATRRLRASEGNRSHLRVIALTANGSLEDRQECLAAGMDDFVAKPVRITDLIRVLGE